MVTGHRTCKYTRRRAATRLQTANGVYAELAKLKQTFPADVEYKVPFESVTVVKVSMQDVVGTLLKTLGPGGYSGVPVPAKLAVNAYPSTGYPGIYFGTFCFFYPARLYYQYPNQVKDRKKKKNC